MKETLKEEYKSDSLDNTGAKYSYSNSGGLTFTSGYAQSVPLDHNITQKIESLIKALGTMVLMPQYQSDPTKIGSKEYVGNVQMPILTDSNREVVVNKLVELVSKL